MEAGIGMYVPVVGWNVWRGVVTYSGVNHLIASYHSVACHAVI